MLWRERETVCECRSLPPLVPPLPPSSHTRVNKKSKTRSLLPQYSPFFLFFFLLLQPFPVIIPTPASLPSFNTPLDKNKLDQSIRWTLHRYCDLTLCVWKSEIFFLFLLSLSLSLSQVIWEKQLSDNLFTRSTEKLTFILHHFGTLNSLSRNFPFQTILHINYCLKTVEKHCCESYNELNKMCLRFVF